MSNMIGRGYRPLPTAFANQDVSFIGLFEQTLFLVCVCGLEDGYPETGLRGKFSSRYDSPTPAAIKRVLWLPTKEAIVQSVDRLTAAMQEFTAALNNLPKDCFATPTLSSFLHCFSSLVRLVCSLLDFRLVLGRTRPPMESGGFPLLL